MHVGFTPAHDKIRNIHQIFIFKRLCDSRKIHYLTREFHVKFHLKNRYRTHRFAIRAISVFRVKFNVEFTSQVMDFPIILPVTEANCLAGIVVWESASSIDVKSLSILSLGIESDFFLRSQK